MFDQLLKLVEQHSGSAIINNPAISNDQNSAAIRTVTEQIVSGLQGQASSGNIQQIISLFQNNGGSITSHPIVTQLIASVAGKFTSDFGVSSSTAQTMATSLLPTIMNQLISKTNNANDSSFDMTSVLQTVGGSNADIGSLLNQFGNNSNLGGSLSSLASKFFGN